MYKNKEGKKEVENEKKMKNIGYKKEGIVRKEEEGEQEERNKKKKKKKRECLSYCLFSLVIKMYCDLV